MFILFIVIQMFSAFNTMGSTLAIPNSRNRLSKDATLSTFTIDGYSASSGSTIQLPYSTSVSVIATPSSDKSSVTINGSTANSGNNYTINVSGLQIGNNTITVIVTAEDVNIVTTNTVTVYVQSNVTTLSTFTVNDTAVDDGSNLSVSYGTSSVTVVATPTSPNASVSVNGDTGLVTGSNILAVTVTPEDTSYLPTSYVATITVNTDSNDTTLSTFTINGYSVTDGLTLNLPYDNVDNYVTVVATSTNVSASVVVTGNTGLTIGNNNINVTVSINSYTSTYTVIVNMYNYIQSLTYSGTENISYSVDGYKLYRLTQCLTTGNLVTTTAYSGSNTDISYIMVGGGGGGGGGRGNTTANSTTVGGGGGGGGQVSYGVGNVTNGTYSVTIGSGGSRGAASTTAAANGTAGGNTVFNGITSTGGDFGRGGGLSHTSVAGGAGYTLNGNTYGTGGLGVGATTVGRNGTDGYSFSFPNVILGAGGGGGSRNQATYSTGGNFGGGRGSGNGLSNSASIIGTAGTEYYGAGGGGGGASTTSTITYANGYSGGSGTLYMWSTIGYLFLSTFTVNGTSVSNGSNVSLASGTSNVTVVATPTDLSSNVTVTGNTNLQTGNNTLYANVSKIVAGNTYAASHAVTLYVISNNSTLSTFTINGTSVTNGSIFSVAYGTSSVTVVAQPTNSTSSVTILGSPANSGNSYTVSVADLQTGSNTIPVIVTAEDPFYVTTNAVTVKVKSNVTTLSTFTMNGTNVSNGSTLSIGYNTTVDVVATPTDTNASVSITGNTGLIPGNNTITVVVTAEDTSITNTSIVTVSVSYALSTFTINGYSVSPGSTLQMPYDSVSNSVSVVATPIDAGASVVITGNTGLTIGNNNITITITGPNNSYTSTYTVVVNIYNYIQSLSYTTGTSNISYSVDGYKLYRLTQCLTTGNLVTTTAYSGSNTDISYIMVGGGGGGGGGRGNTTSNTTTVGGGGGGGGQVSYGIGNVTNGTYSVTIGSGGSGGAASTSAALNGTAGSSTVFNGITSTGGNFGRGGGLSNTTVAGGAGYTLNGTIYGTGGLGVGATTVGRNGTDGYSFSFPNVRLGAGGGGGSRNQATYSTGGNFGGGRGSANGSVNTASIIGTAGTANYGAGGGGGGATTIAGNITYANGYSGGSGTLYMWSTIGYLSLSTFTVNGTSVSNGSNVSLASGTSNVTVVATPTDLSSNVTITGNTNLQSGNNTLYANVSKIVDGNTYAASHAVTLYVQSTVTTLSTFTINGTSVTNGSTVLVAYGTSSVTVVATPTISGSSVSISGNTGLQTGNNTLTATVTAQDPNYVTTNVVTVKVKANVTTLSTFTINGTNVSNGSTVSIGYTTNSVSVIAIPIDTNASVSINGSTANSGNNYTVTVSGLVYGNNTITVVVSAEDTSYTSTSIVTASVSIALSTFTINGYSVSPGSTLQLPYGDSGVSVVATPIDAGASVSINDSTANSGNSYTVVVSSLTIGNNNITITITGPSSSYTFTYTVIVNMYNYIQSLTYSGTANISYSVEQYKLYRLTQCLTSGSLVTTPAYYGWSALGSGVNNYVRAFVFDSTNQILYIGGLFTTAGGISANYIAKYTVSSGIWSALGSGAGGNVYALAFDSTNQILYVGGQFNTVSGGTIAANRIVKYNVSSGIWSALGSGVSGYVNTLALDSTNQILYVGGAFITAGGNITVNRIAKYNVSSGIWSALGSGVNGTVHALEFDSTNQILYVGGEFTIANTDNITVNQIAKYTVSSGIWSALGSGVSNYVYALAFDSTNQILYVGGDFINSNLSITRIAKYTVSSGIWSALGSVPVGVNSPVRAFAFDSTNQILYVGGEFTSAGGNSSIKYIAKYTVSSNSWSALESGVNAYVYALEFDSTNQILYVGGQFATANDVVSANFIAKNYPNNNTSYNTTDISYIMVGGGGGGGGGRGNTTANTTTVGGGGGGGGQVSYGIGNVTNGTYSVTIGSGGSGGAASTTTAANGTAGSSTVFNGITSTGGNFGRGGGLSNTTVAGGAGYTLNGTIYGTGGLGVGDTTVGRDASDGYSFSFPNVRLGAGGGGGARLQTTYSAGGNFGGGRGSGNGSSNSASIIGTAGTANYGAGGGGGGATTIAGNITYANGYSGGSGTLYMWSTIGYLSLSTFTVNGTSVSNGSNVSLVIGTSNVTVVATPTDLSSNVTITGNTNLQSGNNTLYANVSKIVAGNTYTVSNAVTLYVQENATISTTLTTFTINGTTVTNGSTFSVAYGTSSVTVVAQPTNSGASVTINGSPANSGNSYTVIVSGIQTGINNNITVIVTAVNPSYVQTYSVIVSDVDYYKLSSLKLNNNSVEIDSTYNLPYYDSVTLTATAIPIDATASVSINGSSANSGNSYTVTVNGLVYGNNTITIIVIGPSSSYTKTYTITVSTYYYIPSISYTGELTSSYAINSYILYRLTQLKTTGSLSISTVSSSVEGWSKLGSGVGAAVNAITIDSSQNIYVGGNFTTAGGSIANYIAKYIQSTSTWSAIGSLNNIVNALAFDTSNQILYVGGKFTTINGSTAKYIAKYLPSTSTWSQVKSGLNNYAYALSFDGSKNLYVGGYFTRTGDGSANYIAKYSPYTNGWSALGAPWIHPFTGKYNINGVDGIVHALAADGSNNIYVAGWPGAAGPTSGTNNIGFYVNRIAKYIVSTNTWSVLGSSTVGLGSAPNQYIASVALDSSQNLYIGGNFTNAGGISVNYIAKYIRSTNSWSALGSGSVGVSSGATVYGLTFDNSNQILYVGGSFTTAGGSSANYVAKYSPFTNTWSTLGSGVNNYVYALALDSSQNVYVGGNFTTASGGIYNVNYITRYSLGNSNNTNIPVDISYIMIGGGGGGGGATYYVTNSTAGGGGGGGQIQYGITNVKLYTAYDVIIGSGGIGGNSVAGTGVADSSLTAGNGTIGGSTIFNGITSLGGLGGTGGKANSVNANGGAGYTFDGNIYGNGGSGVGATVGTNGTDGYYFSFPNVRLGAGGGGGSRSNSNSVGGNIGGGNGSGNASSLAGTAGTANYGTGGGGGGSNSYTTNVGTYANGYSGGSGTLYMWSLIGYLSLSKFTVNGTSVSNGSNVSLATGTTSVTVIATPFDISSNVTVTGNTNLQPGNNTLYANVSKILEGTTYTSSYAVTLNVPASNTSFTTFTINGTTVTDGSTFSVAYGTSSVSVKAQPYASTASVSVNGSTANYSNSYTVNVSGLVTGDNTLTVIINYLTETKTYTVTIRVKSNVATLSTLSLNGVNVNNGDVVSIPYGYTDNISLITTPTNSSASVLINGSSSANSGNSYTVILNSLQIGNNTITILVTAEDTSYTNNYTFTINYYNTYSSIKINGTSYTPGSTITYSYNNNYVVVEVITLYTNASYSVTGNTDLIYGNNTVTVTITGPNNSYISIYTYTIFIESSIEYVTSFTYNNNYSSTTAISDFIVYRVVEIQNTGTLNIITARGSFIDVSYIMVGGGGGGGGGQINQYSAPGGGGGGGGGQVISGTVRLESNIDYSITIGAGGSGGLYRNTQNVTTNVPIAYPGSNGGTTIFTITPTEFNSDTTFDTINAYGGYGGLGGKYSADSAGGNGYTYNSVKYGTGGTSEGYRKIRDASNGYTISYLNTSITLGGGGGGGTNNYTLAQDGYTYNSGYGGSGGGGKGSNGTSSVGSNGTSNTGGGGGGGASAGGATITNATGYRGGSGVSIIWFPIYFLYLYNFTINGISVTNGSIITVASGTTSVSVAANPIDNRTAVSISGNSGLQTGTNIVTVTVSQSGYSSSYTVYIVVNKSYIHTGSYSSLTNGSYNVITITGNGYFSVNDYSVTSKTLNYILIGGGGGGGGGYINLTGTAVSGGSGGGGGQILVGTTTINTNTNYYITIGQGGSGGSGAYTLGKDGTIVISTDGSNGSSTIFNNITALGGIKGLRGQTSTNIAGGLGYTYNSIYGTGGYGAYNTSVSRNGTNGYTLSYASSLSITLGGGGGGGTFTDNSATRSSGGTGGGGYGGIGGLTPSYATNGTSNTGGGGGGGGSNNKSYVSTNITYTDISYNDGFNGGSGCAIFWYTP